jgi:hypothetical protein
MVMYCKCIITQDLQLAVIVMCVELHRSKNKSSFIDASITATMMNVKIVIIRIQNDQNSLKQ